MGRRGAPILVAVLLAGPVGTGCAGSNSHAPATPSASRAAPTPAAVSPRADVLFGQATKLLLGSRRVTIEGAEPPTATDPSHFLLRYADGNVAADFTVTAGRVQLRLVGGTAYINAPASYWRSVSSDLAGEPAAIAKVADKWISTPASGSEFGQLVDLPHVIQPMLKAASPLELGLLPVTRETDGGRPVYTLRDPQGPPQSRIEIAASGPPYLLRLIGRSSTGPVELTLTGYGASAPVTVPPGAMTVQQALAS